MFVVGLCLVSGGLEDLTVSHIRESLEQVQETETHLPGHYCATAGQLSYYNREKGFHKTDTCVQVHVRCCSELATYN